MLFTDFLKKHINELYVKELGREYYVLPINIKNSNDVQAKVDEVLECLKIFLKKGNLKISWRDKNYNFFKYFHYNKRNPDEFLKRFATNILNNLKSEHFVKETVSETNIAYVFVTDEYEEFVDLAKQYKAKHVYVKFSFVIKPKDKKSHSIISNNNDNIIVDMRSSYVDFISIHF